MPNIREIKRASSFFNTFIMYCMIIALAQSQFLINYIQTNIDTISAQAIYNIKFLRFSTTPLPLQSQLRIVFSNDYIGRIITNPLCSSPTFNTTVLSCTYFGNTLIIDNMFNSSEALTSLSFILSVSNITNPSPAKDYVPIQEIRIIGNDSTSIEQENITISINIKPAQATCNSLILNGFTYSRGQISINYRSNFITVNNGFNLSISIPSYYTDDATATSINPTFTMPITFIPQAATNSYLISFLSNFTITMLMPPSTEPQNNFISIYSYNELGIFDQCSISITNIQANQFLFLNISSKVVQRVTSLDFHLQLSTPLFAKDIIIIKFDPSFSLSQVSNQIDIQSFGTETISIINNNIEISSISLQPIINATIKFTLNAVGMPFTTANTFINVSLITFDNYNKIIQSYPYTASFGSIVGSIACLNQEIGTLKTSCIFNINTSSSIDSRGYIDIVFPNQFQIAQGSEQCGITGVGLNSVTNCRYIELNSTIKVQDLTSVNNIISPINIVLNISINMPRLINLYSIAVYTNAFFSKVDLGTFTLQTLSRQLKSNEFQVRSSSLMTYSPTTYSLMFSLPFDLGLTYRCLVYVPFDVQPGLSADISGATFISLHNGILAFSALGLTNNSTISINNLLTYNSLQPIGISINVTFNNLIYFKGQFTLTLQQLKTFSYIQYQITNQQVYSNAILNLSLSELSVSDKLVLRPSYNYLYPSSQANCSTSIVSCGISAMISILSIRNEPNNLTKFSFNIVNLAFVGESTVNITLYDSSQAFAKLSSIVTLKILYPNVIALAASQSNPSLNQVSTYTFNITLNTPNAQNLRVVFSSDLSVLSSQCILGCAQAILLPIGYIFSITSLNIVVKFTINNPITFQNSKIIFKTLNANGDVDYAEYFPITACIVPCRTCKTSNQSLCDSCYTWQTLLTLFNQSCVASCPNGYYQNTFSLGQQCSICDSKCFSCFGISTNCSVCKAGFFYYANACYSACPRETFTSNNFTCIDCTVNCSICTSQSCSVCKNQSYLYNGLCLSTCPSGNFINGSVCSVCFSCLTCSVTNGTCFLCQSPFVLYIGTCWSACPANVFYQSIDNKCQICQSPCQTCSETSKNCTSCISTHFYLSNKCHATACPIGYFSRSGINICLVCPSTCYGCISGFCTSCNSSSLLYQGVCHATCPNGSFQNTTICNQCNSTCSTCLSIQTCTNCVNTHYLLNSSCLSQCPNLYYANTTSNKCFKCAQPCLNCNMTGCLSCLSEFYLQQQICTLSCQYPFYPNNASMICQVCQFPCNSCEGWSRSCKSCASTYYFLNASCYLNCPNGYYADNAKCLECPSSCLTCSLYNSQPICTSCRNNETIYSASCVSECPLNTTLVGIYCASSDCSSLANCLSCSGFRCIQCSSVYNLDRNFQCSQFVSTSQVLAAFSKIPVPFPFLIAIIMVIIISFFLKHNFDKMFSPFFIYSLAGVFQFLCIVLWALLTMAWNLGNQIPLPVSSIIYVPILIIMMYLMMNVAQFVVWKQRIASDKIYKLWQLQDNKCPSVSLAIISLVLSFRLDIMKFSRVANSYKLSARLSSQAVFHPYSVIAGISIFVISAFSLIVSIYISYLQTELNYLFFTCFEISIIAIIMTVLSIVMLCVPKKLVIENKEEYQVGFDNFQLEGKSIEQLMNGLQIIQEHEYNAKYSQSGHAICHKNRYGSEGQSQDITLLDKSLKNEASDEFKLQVQSGDEYVQPRKKKIASENDDIFAYSVEQNDDHILVDQIQRDKQDGIHFAKQYVPIESLQKKTDQVYTRQEGVIYKQNLSVLEEEPSYEQSLHSFQQYTLDLRQKEWKATQNKKVNELVIQMEQKQSQQILKLKEEERKRRKQYELIKSLKRIRKENSQFKQKQQETKKQKHQKNAKEIKKIDDLNKKLKELQDYQMGLYKHEDQLLDQQSDLLQREEQKERQSRERANMGIQDKLSHYAQVFQQMKEKAAFFKKQFKKNNKRKIKKTQKQQQDFKEYDSKEIKYSNDDSKNLINELSPKKVKVNPKPLPSQYKKKHIFIEENTQILSQDSKSSSDYEEIEMNIVYQEEIYNQKFPEVNPATNLQIQRKRQEQIQHFQRDRGQIFNESQAKKIKEYVNSLNKTDRKKRQIPMQKEQAQFPIAFSNHEEDNLSDIKQMKTQRMQPQREYMSEKTETNQEQIIQAFRHDQEETVQNEPIDIQYSSRQVNSHSSEGTHWPIEPEMEERIRSIEQKANEYIKRPKRQISENYVFERAENKEILEQGIQYEQYDQENMDYVYEDRGEDIYEDKRPTFQNKSRESTQKKKKYPLGRVNRHIIDLSPDS